MKADHHQINVADNLSQVAQDIIDYILKASFSVEERLDHQRELFDVIALVKQQYVQMQTNWLVISLFESWIYHYTRVRSQDLDQASLLISEADAADQLILLDIITGVLERGGLESTSVNTLLLNELIRKTKKYTDIDEDVRFQVLGRHESSSKVGVRAALRDIFIKKAKETSETYQKLMERNQAVMLLKSPVVQSLKVDVSFREQLSRTLSNRADVKQNGLDQKVDRVFSERKKLDQAKFGKLINQLSDLYRNDSEKNKPHREVVKDKREPADSFSEARANLKFFFEQKQTGSPSKRQEEEKNFRFLS